MELTELCNLLGWQGGTIHQAKEEIERLKDQGRELLEHKALVMNLTTFFDGLEKTPDETKLGDLRSIICAYEKLVTNLA